MTKAEETTAILAELRELAPAGYAVALHVCFAAPRFLFQTYPPAWMDYYSRTGAVMDDPAVRWGFVNDGIADWDVLTEMDDKDIFGTAQTHGLNYWTVVATSKEGSKSFGAFSRSEVPFSDAQKDRIQTLLVQVHGLSLTAKDDPDFEEQLSALSLRQTHTPPQD